MKRRQVLTQFLKPKLVIFAASVINLLWHLRWVWRVELEIRAATESGHFPWGHWNPVAVMFEPVLLLVAALGLLFNRWWTVMIAMLASGRVIYRVGYLPFSGVHYAHGDPMFSWGALQKVWSLVYTPQPQYLFESLLGIVIFIYAVVVFLRFLHSQSTIATPGG